jgi:hypothetical protein
MVDQSLSGRTKQAPFSVLGAGSTPAGIPNLDLGDPTESNCEVRPHSGLMLFHPLKGGHRFKKIGIFPMPR